MDPITVAILAVLPALTRLRGFDPEKPGFSLNAV